MYKSLESKIRDMLEGKTGAISVTKDRDTMEHDPNDQVTVGTYKSKHFEISPEAQKLFSQGIPKNSNAIDAEHLAIHHDKLFALVKGAMVKKQVSDTDLENAKDHMSKIQYLATKLGLEGEINYLQPHVEKLFKHAGTEGNPFTSKPTEYTQEPRDFDVDNTKQFITRAAKAERKVKVIDDEFNPEETEMVADKNLGANPAVVEAAKKVMEKLDPVGKEDKDVNNDGKVDSTDGYLKKRRNAISSAMRAARQKEVQKKVDAESKKQWKKPPQAGTLSAMKKEEVEQVEEAVTSNPGHGYHGQHSDNADQKYSKMHAKVRSLTGTNSTMAKHYLDSTHGRHLAGYEDDHEYIKRDFLKFAKKYKTDQFKEEVESVNEDQASDMQKIQSMDKGSMVGSKTELNTHLKYLNAMHTHQKKYGLDTAKTKKKIGDVSRSLVQMGEEAEQVDEAQKKLKPSYWKAEWRLGTQSEVDKNNKKIFDKLAKTDPVKASAFHDNLMRMKKKDVKEEAEQVDEAKKTKKEKLKTLLYRNRSNVRKFGKGAGLTTAQKAAARRAIANEEVEQTDEAVRIVDAERGLIRKSNVKIRPWSFSASDARDRLAQAAKERRKITGEPGVKGFNKDIGYAPIKHMDTGYVRAIKKEDVEQVDEANMRFDPEAAARPKSSDVKNFLNRDKNARAGAASKKYIRRMTKLGGLGPNQTKKDTEKHMKDYFEEVEISEASKEGKSVMYGMRASMKAMDLRHGVDSDKRDAGYKMSPAVRAAQAKSDALSKVEKPVQAGTLAALKRREMKKEAVDPGSMKVVNKKVKAADKMIKAAKGKVNKIDLKPTLDLDSYKD